MADLFSTQLEECSWRGISFPIEMVAEKGGQRLAIHHKMDRDGAQIEGTGRMPYSFSVKAFFLEGLTQGTNESWADLYPSTWLNIRSLLERRDSGTFVHPLYSKIQCKPVSWSASFVSEVRSGVIVDMEFIETIDDTDGTITLQPSVISSATSSALDLDTQNLSNLGVPPPKMLGQESFSDSLSLITSSSGTQAVGLINQQVNDLFVFIDSIIDIAGIASTLDSLYAFMDALTTLSLQFELKEKETSIFVVGFDTTLASIAGFVGNTLENIIQLNPTLVSEPIIQKDTEITYYTI